MEKWTKEIEVTKKLHISSEDVDDIMSTAFEGGINYWVNKVEVVGEYLGEYASEQISRGGTLKLHDYEAEKVYELTLDKLIEGVKKYIGGVQTPYEIAKDGEIDTCMVDADVADMIVQYAVFGELVYG